MKGQIERLNTTVAEFDGFQPIESLEFLASLMEAFDAFKKSDAVPVWSLAFFLSDDAREC